MTEGWVRRHRADDAIDGPTSRRQVLGRHPRCELACNKVTSGLAQLPELVGRDPVGILAVSEKTTKDGLARGCTGSSDVGTAVGCEDAGLEAQPG